MNAPPARKALADAMTRLADQEGISRERWAIRALAAAAASELAPAEYAVLTGQSDESDMRERRDAAWVADA